MKLTAVLLIISCLQLSARSDAQSISISQKNTTLEKVFKEIHRKTGYQFFYQDELLRQAKKFDINVKDASVEQVLDLCFKDQPLNFTISEKTITIKSKEEPTTSSSLAPPIEIRGTVIDQNGKPLAGVTVSLVGQTGGISTNESGGFSMTVPDNAVLSFSYVGYKTVTQSVKGKTNITVTMAINVASMEEMVVIGYGKSKRVNLTSAQTSISSKDMDRTINSTIEQAIQGRSAGVYVTQNSGQPGGAMSVNIRGISSINGSTEPLYVIDGVQIPGEPVSYGAQSSANPLAGINPSDIDNVEILQGPSASAIYGSRATNGVVLITTKRGKAGDTKINLGMQYGVQAPPKHLDVMNLSQYAQMVKEYHAVAGGQTPAEFLDPSLLGTGTDWQSELFKSAPMANYQLSLSGGNDKSNYYLGGEYFDQDGVAVGSGFNRSSVRFNFDFKPRQWISIGTNLSFNQTNQTLTTSQENIISNALQLTPQVPVKNLDGSWGGGDLTNGAGIYAPVNPIAIANLKTNTLLRRQFLGGLNVGINITKDLVFRTTFNTNVGYNNSTYFQPTYEIGWAINATASLTSGTGTNNYWNWNQLLQYTKQLGKHNFDVMASHEAQESNWENVSATRTGFLTNDIFDLNAGDPTTASNSGGKGTWGMESWLGRLNYNFDNRYLLTGTMRADGSSNFGPENKWGYFPSLSVAWRVSQEKFFNVSWISELKLRAETGVTGNQGGGGGIYSPLSTGATPTGTGFLPSRYSNPGLKWENTQSNDFGINIGFAKNRIQLEADYFVKNTNNLLMDNPLPWYMGTNGTGAVGSPTVNIGDLQNKGWGLTLTTVNIVKKDFKWESNLNFSSFKTTIQKFYSDAAYVNRTSWWLNDWTQRSAVGQAPWLFRGYVEDGIFQSIGEINKSAVPVDNNGNRLPIEDLANGINGISVGDVKFKDISGPSGRPDGIIDSYDETNIGNPWPKLFGGFTNSLSYKNFDMSIFIIGTFGNDIYNYIGQVNSNPNNVNLSRNFLTDAMNYAKPITNEQGELVLSNPKTDVPRISHGPNGNYARATTKWVEDGSFVRIKNISLTYNLPAKVLAAQKFLKGARVTISAQNVVTWTNYSGMDPEVGSYVGRDTSPANQAIGLDYGRYPLTPIYTFNLGINF
jgi:TonB-dependent starch-binding outer membrane protein SusC